jgi:hypothetical protein
MKKKLSEQYKYAKPKEKRPITREEKIQRKYKSYLKVESEETE